MLYRLMLSLLLIGISMANYANNADEINRIKRNYARLLIQAEDNSMGLKDILSAIAPETEMSDQMVVELHQRYPFDLKKIDALLNNLTEQGSWSDINYSDKKRSGWEPKNHAERILELVKLYQSPTTDYYKSAQLKAAIHRALNYWFDAKLVCLNWWYNQIGVPKTLGAACLLFEDELTDNEREKAIVVLRNAKFGMTGQNKVWLAGNVLMRALLENDYDMIKAARNEIASEIVTGAEEGIKADWSFHQHGAQQQFGNYGLSYISGMSFYSALFSGTSLMFNDEQLQLLASLIDQGYRWIIWRNTMDVNALGRQLFHNAQLHKPLSLGFAALDLGGGESANCNQLAREVINGNYNSPQNTLVGHKHFWESDHTTHRQPQWMASIKMASDRVIGVESLNGDNMQGYYMADGATYIYRTGQEYLNIFPLWDWRKVPGVTAVADTASMPRIANYRPRNKGSFVGGVSDGESGMSVMQLDRGGVKGYKSWICTDRYLLCLGSGITSDTALAITTTIDQAHLQGSIDGLQNKKWMPITTQANSTESVQRYHHNRIGYIVMNGAEVTAKSALHVGQWHDVMQMYAPAQVSDSLFTLYINHGASPRNAGYQYLILPDADKVEVARFDLSTIRLLQNDEKAQVVHTADTDQYWIAAFQPIHIKLSSRHQLNIVTPGIYMYKPIKRKGAMLNYADPTQTHEVAELYVNDRLVTLPLSAQWKGETVMVIID